MVDFIEFFRPFDLGEGSRRSILMNFSDFSTLRPGVRGYKWLILFKFFDFSTFRPDGESLNGRFY